MPRKICFVTGTRAEFGLMQSTLSAIDAHRKLRLQIVVTGSHLSRRLGSSIDDIRSAGWKIDATVPWDLSDPSPAAQAIATGKATAALAQVFQKLRSDVVLVVGDRIEAFAAASAAHISAKLVAHVHGGDRALGQVDDSLRHAITKLAHVHFPATRQSAARIAKMGEDAWRIFCVGAPGLDDLKQFVPEIPRTPSRLALVLLHPTDANARAELQRATLLARCTRKAGIEHVVFLYPNSDPGNQGIRRAWDQLAKAGDPNWKFIAHLPRAKFLLLLASCAMLIGNSSAGIIEAASFGVPVINIGLRQAGRECGNNVIHVPWNERSIIKSIKDNLNAARRRRLGFANPYGQGNAGRHIADILGRLKFDSRFARKLIAY